MPMLVDITLNILFLQNLDKIDSFSSKFWKLSLVLNGGKRRSCSYQLTWAP